MQSGEPDEDEVDDGGGDGEGGVEGEGEVRAGVLAARSLSSVGRWRPRPRWRFTTPPAAWRQHSRSPRSTRGTWWSKSRHSSRCCHPRKVSCGRKGTHVHNTHGGPTDFVHAAYGAVGGGYAPLPQVIRGLANIDELPMDNQTLFEAYFLCTLLGFVGACTRIASLSAPSLS
jgi:hypothetical protein